ncbi:MAG: hypothetical protein P8X55_09635 [Desulfosarcinaceae bacterium]
MGAVTYPNPSVAQIVNELYIPVQLDVEKETKRAEQYMVLWTPNINVVDHRERVFFHFEGWISPMEYTAMLLCGRGHYDLHRKQFDQAVASFKRVIDNFPESVYAPQAHYYAAVGHYLSTHEVDRLLAGWERLRQAYPENEWAYRTHL